MKSRILVRQAAKSDLLRHAAYIAKNNPPAAIRFLDAAKQTVEQLAGLPSLGTAYAANDPRLADLRRFRVKGFEDYLIFYRPLKFGIEVVRFIHGARDIGAILGS